MPRVSRLILVLGDQLDLKSAAFDGFDQQEDAIWMAEVAEESTKVWSTKPRIAMFLTAMRHFRETLRGRGWKVIYHEMGAHADFARALQASVTKLKPQTLVMVHAGDWSVQQEIEKVAAELKVPLEVREDHHFFCTTAEFAKHAEGRKQLRMEFFFREMRQKTGCLMEKDKPVGGQWNFEHDNRGSFGKDGPGLRVPPRRFKQDAITQEVITMVNQRFAKHPGALDDFDWLVTAEEARVALTDFIEHRLAEFGQYQDAMWTNEPWLYH